MHDAQPSGLPEGTPEFADPYTDLAVRASSNADTLSLVVIGIFVVILILGVLRLAWMCR